LSVEAWGSGPFIGPPGSGVRRARATDRQILAAEDDADV
jgi:hypothetical protein